MVASRLPGAEVVQAAHLEAEADLPDAAEHQAMTPIVLRQPHSPPRSGCVSNGTGLRPWNGYESAFQSPDSV